MSEPRPIEFFVEDEAHRHLLVPLVKRVAGEAGVRVSTRVRNARGGHAAAIGAFKQYQMLVAKGVVGPSAPSLLVVAIDANCSSFAKTAEKIRREKHETLPQKLVTACPDPHIERWYLADPQSFRTVVGTQPVLGPKKCTRGRYKQILSRAIVDAGHPSTLGGVEFGSDLANAMDLFRAGKNDSSLKAFVRDLRHALRQKFWVGHNA
ncbi:MAG: hypothetical protein OXN89_14145 [Bryobacterales bacterium]|nr:hypothetical protein [Bryobacterales bacterium]